MHRPQLSRDTFIRQIRTGFGRTNIIVEPDKIERGADPGDTGDQVQPAHQQVEPFDAIGEQIIRQKVLHGFLS